ncbi:Solute carrier family 12 member 8 [Sarcoptes scabiei]|uniref:Solute carrier family 12 member 8 n=1 Tax=Sarcoptes scabiei TaxID=52283 RepID=A0A834VDG5_SARSC|nr:Solute carrier family 12 member 8 [Sarcoptes scabiei]
MSKKISKIISHAKHRLSGRKNRSHASQSSLNDYPSVSSSHLDLNEEIDDRVRRSASQIENDDDSFVVSDQNRLLNDRSRQSIRPNSDPSPTETDQIVDPESGSAKNHLKSSDLFRMLFPFRRTDTEQTREYRELYEENSTNDTKRDHHHIFSLTSSVNFPSLFGTWNGVFITVVVHLFGVISFLRIGWMVGNEGALLSIIIVFVCLLFNTISLLAAIGIIERCAAVTANRSILNDLNDHRDYPNYAASARANLHILVSTILGSKFGGAISLIYFLGQAISCALHVRGFSETFIHLSATFIKTRLKEYRNRNETISIDTKGKVWEQTIARMLQITINGSYQRPELIITNESYKFLSILLIVILFLINIIGVRWLFRFQTLLFLALVSAIADFTIGLFQSHPDYGFGELVATKQHFQDNLLPNIWTDPLFWSFWKQLFNTIGIIFPATIGVMAGVNMGCDLEHPIKSIPIGSFAAIISSYLVHVLFIIGLALTCGRLSLLNDYAVAQHVSALGFFFAFGFYMSTISSSLGSMYTAPRIMQNLAQELQSVPIVRWFAQGRGPNNIPINALILFTIITISFVMIGGINVLAPIATIPYLMTYAAVEYAYFSMAMTFDIQIQREKSFMLISSQLKSQDSDGNSGSEAPRTTIADNDKKEKIETKSLNGDENSQKKDLLSPSPSMQSQTMLDYGSIQNVTKRIKVKRRQSTQSSESEDEQSMMRFKSTLKTKPKQKIDKPKIDVKPKTVRQLMKAQSDSDSDDDDDDGDGVGDVKDKSNTKTNERFRFKTSKLSEEVCNEDDYKNPDINERLLLPDPELAEIACKQEVWYLRLMNRWLVLLAAIIKIILMFVIAWNYAIATIVMVILFSIVIGRTNPGYYLGVSEFSIKNWLQNRWFRMKKFSFCNNKDLGSNFDQSNPIASFSYEKIILPSTNTTIYPEYRCESNRLTEENLDYSERPSCHCTTIINSQLK